MLARMYPKGKKDMYRDNYYMKAFSCISHNTGVSELSSMRATSYSVM